MISAIIPAAGKSSRMGKEVKKQFLKLNDKEIIIRTLQKFESNDSIDEIVLIISREDEKKINKLIDQYHLKKIKLAYGGNSRQESVYNGINRVSSDSEIVLIHDGARPFIDEKIINKTIDQVKKYEAVTVGVRTKDTIKRIDDQLFIVETLNREELVNVQTPQAFKKGLIEKAHLKAKEEGFSTTDDAALVEYIGKKVKFIEGSYDNIKITTPEDIYKGISILKKGETEI